MKQYAQQWVDTLFDLFVPGFVQERIPRQVILYIVYGSISTSVDILLFYIGGAFWGLGYIAAATLSFFAAGTTSFVLNKYLNFKNDSKKLVLQYIVFFAIGASSLLFTYLFLYVFIDILFMHRMAAKVITSLILAVYAYFANTSITFGHRYFQE